MAHVFAKGRTAVKSNRQGRQDAALLAVAALLVAANTAIGMRFRGVRWRDQPQWVGIVRAGLASAATASLVRFGDVRHDRKPQVVRNAVSESKATHIRSGSR